MKARTLSADQTRRDIDAMTVRTPRPIGHLIRANVDAAIARQGSRVRSSTVIRGLLPGSAALTLMDIGRGVLVGLRDVHAPPIDLTPDGPRPRPSNPDAAAHTPTVASATTSTAKPSTPAMVDTHQPVARIVFKRSSERKRLGGTRLGGYFIRNRVILDTPHAGTES